MRLALPITELLESMRPQILRSLSPNEISIPASERASQHNSEIISRSHGILSTEDEPIPEHNTDCRSGCCDDWMSVIVDRQSYLCAWVSESQC